MTCGKKRFASIIGGLEDRSTDREVAEKQLFGLLSDDSRLIHISIAAIYISNGTSNS